MTIQPARHECHTCCPLQAEKPGIQPVVGNTHVKQVVSSFQKILRGSELTWYTTRYTCLLNSHFSDRCDICKTFCGDSPVRLSQEGLTAPFLKQEDKRFKKLFDRSAVHGKNGLPTKLGTRGCCNPQFCCSI